MKEANQSQQFWTPEQRELARKLFCSELPQDQGEQFLTICERTGLDPFTRQIYGRAQSINLAKRGEQPKWGKTLVVITGIDGLRSLAERTGEYRGQTKPEWYYDDGYGDGAKWHDHFLGIGRGIKPPEAARVGIYREKFVEPLFGVATYDSFAQFSKGENGKYAPTSFWQKMPDVQLLKCAEAQALRKAFPLVLSGLYIEEEVQSTDEEPAGEREEALKQTKESIQSNELPKVAQTRKRTPKQADKTPEQIAADAKAKEDAIAAQASAPATESAPVQQAKKTEPLDTPGAAPEPEEEADEETPQGGGPAIKNQGYRIKTVTHKDYAGKTLGEIGIPLLEKLYKLVYPANEERIKLDPVKREEWDIIIAYIQEAQK